ncbi:MAG TPA: FAD:protein FMN transferase [Desulfosalsimonadaceae bacterium]|nr:FAD:protein FMN transferase [Desulfosalsimonadaceae bacterium]
MAGKTGTWIKPAAVAAALFLIGAGILLAHLYRKDAAAPKTQSRREPPGSAQSADAPAVKQIAPEWWESSRRIYFDIPARIRVHLPDTARPRIRRIFSHAWDEFDRLGKIFNPFADSGETAALNQEAATEWRAVSTELYEVLTTAKKLWKASGGGFDPTFLPVKKLWQQAEKHQQIPSHRQVQKALSQTGFENVSLRAGKTPQMRLQKPEIRFDFGGIAKGYILDQIRQLLKSRGADAGLVQLGGEIAAFGRNRGGPWRIGIQHPKDMAKLWGVVTSRSAIRVSTSGNYRQPLIIQGRSFYHIFSPETGRPVSERILGVTTVSPEGAHSNALLDGAATAMTVIGVERGLKLAKKLGIEVLLLTRGPEGHIRENRTRGFARIYKKNE